MEYQKRLIDDFMKEVDAVVERVRVAKTVSPFLTAGNASVSDEDLDAASAQYRRLERVVAELQGRLGSELLRLESESRTRRRLDERVAELSERARQLEEQALSLEREKKDRAARASELESTLAASEAARKDLIAELDRSRSETEAARGEGAIWRKKWEEFAPTAKEKEEAVAAALKRYDDASRIFKDEMAERVREIHRLNGEVARARTREEAMSSHLDEEHKKIAEERERLRRQADQAMENAESIRREGVAALEEARGLRDLSGLRADLKAALERLGPK